MSVSSAEKLARRVHRGQVDRNGAPYVEHLERVTGRVAALGGDSAAVEAAWLYSAVRVGVPLESLAARGVSRPALGILQALSFRGVYGVARGVQAAAHSPGAALVWQVVDEDLAATMRRWQRSPAAASARTRTPVTPPSATPAPPRPPSRPPFTAETARAALDGDDPHEAQSAIDWLLSSGTTAAVASLVRVLRRPEPAWRYARLKAFDWLARSRDALVWREIAAAAVVTGDGLDPHRFSRNAPRELAPDLVAMLDGDGFPAMHAAMILGLWQERAAVAALSRVARDTPDPLLAMVSVGALAQLRPDGLDGLVGAQGHTDPRVRSVALKAIAGFADDATVTTAALRGVDDVDPWVRRRAVRLLAERGDTRGLPALLRACEGGVPSARYAMAGLARLGDPRAVPTLTEVFTTTPDRRLRDLAGRALVASASRDVGVPDLFVYEWGDRHLMRATAWVLGRAGDLFARSSLERGLRMGDPVLRARCADSLGRLGNVAAAPALREALADIAPIVRANAATALARLGTAEAPEWLEPLTRDPDKNVSTAAKAALRRLVSPSPPRSPGPR